MQPIERERGRELQLKLDLPRDLELERKLQLERELELEKNIFAGSAAEGAALWIRRPRGTRVVACGSTRRKVLEAKC